MSMLFDTPQTQPPHSAPAAVPMNADARHAAEAEDAKAERRLKDAVRRYYALAELVETERGYVEDLRILVEVSFVPMFFVSFSFLSSLLSIRASLLSFT